MSILNKLLGNAQGAARGGTYGRGRPTRSTSRGAGVGRGIGMARRPAPRRTGYGRQPTTAASGLGGLIGGLLRRR